MIEKLHTAEIIEMDRQIKEWGSQGFQDIAEIVFEDSIAPPESTPILSADDFISRHVKTMRVQGMDLFVTTKSDEIFHYRMTVTRL